MNYLSLFSGAGLGDLGLQHILGWRCLGYVEWEDYCQRILRARQDDGYLDAAPIYGDIREFVNSGHAASYQGMVDVVSGGFPCQPFSLAGKRKGEDDTRNMWPAMLECIRQIRPRFAFMENVPGLTAAEKLTLLCLEKIRQTSFFDALFPQSVKRRINRVYLKVAGRSYFGRVLGDLAESGYNAEWRCLSAAECGAPHKRDRLWIVAYAIGDGSHTRRSERARFIGASAFERTSGEAMADADMRRLEERKEQHRQTKQNTADGNTRGGYPCGCDNEVHVADATGGNAGKSKAGDGRQGFGRGSPSQSWWAIDPADLPDADQQHDDHGRYGAGAVLRERSEEAGIQTGDLSDADNRQRTNRRDCSLREIKTGFERTGIQSDQYRKPQPGLDIMADGRSDRMDFARTIAGGPLPRVATGVPDRTNRLKALGNGQVPVCAATAWRLLTEELGL